MIHGWGQSRLAFGLLSEALSPWHTPFALDLAGHGAAKQAAGPYSFQRYIQDISSAASAFGDDGFHLLGWSMGGTIAAKYVLEGIRPAPKSLILISAPARFVAPKEEAGTGLRPASIRRQIEFLEADHAKGLAGFIEMFFMSGEAIDPVREPVIREMLAPKGEFPPARQALLDTLAELAATDLTGHPSAPMSMNGLIMSGSLDKICPMGGQALWDAVFTGMRRAPLDGCGHAPHLTRPGEAASIINHFLSEC